MISLRHTALGLALSLAFAGHAMAVTTIPFWHSMEGENWVKWILWRNVSTRQSLITKLFRCTKATTSRAWRRHRRLPYRQRAGAVLQVYEVGTATMMASKAIKPVYRCFSEAGIKFDESQFVPTVAGLLHRFGSHLLSSRLTAPRRCCTTTKTPSKSRFRSGTAAENPQDLAAYTAKLKAAGMKCGYASGWQGWIQIENFSAWHGLPVATKTTAFRRHRRGSGVQQAGAGEAYRHARRDEQERATSSYFGRKDESTEKFYNGDCAITTASSGSPGRYPPVRQIQLRRRHDAVRRRREGRAANAIIGGASLWVMQGKDKETHRRGQVPRFSDQTGKCRRMAPKTGYLPITTAAYIT